MKKILVALLSTLMLLTTPSFLTHAATGPAALADEGEGMNVSVTASQNGDGDLVISVSGDQKDEFINFVMEDNKYLRDDSGSKSRISSGGQIDIVSSLTSFSFSNIEYYNAGGSKISDEKIIEREGDNLIIRKANISRYVNLAQDTIKIYFNYWNESWNITNLLEYEVSASVQFEGAPTAINFSLINCLLKSPVVGASTNIDLTTAYLLDQNDEKVYPYSDTNTNKYFNIYWADYNENNGIDSLPVKTNDDKFVKDKGYQLIMVLKYPNNNNRAFIYYQDYNEGERSTELDFSSSNSHWAFVCGYGVMEPEYYMNYAPTIVTGSNYLESVSIMDENLDTEDRNMINEGIRVYEYLIINNQDIDSETIKKFEDYAKETGYTFDDAYSLRIMKNSWIGYLNEPLNGREITNLGHDAEILVPIRDDIINTDKNIERKYQILYIEDNEIKTVDLGFSSYMDKEELDGDVVRGAVFNTNKANTFALVYKDVKKKDNASVSISDTPVKSYDSKDTNQDGVIDCSEEMNNANWIWSNTKKACVYKVSNTSTK